VALSAINGALPSASSMLAAASKSHKTADQSIKEVLYDLYIVFK
jgi:hypothetical protein